MLKTLVMTTGEFEFDTLFIDEQELVDEGLSLFLPELTGIFWVIFIIIMPIIFSNLLVYGYKLAYYYGLQHSCLTDD